MFEHATSTDKKGVNPNSKKPNSIILQRIAKIQHNYLKIVDIELFKHLKLLEVEF